MKSIDKLRDLADDINAKEIVEHMQLYPNCVFDCCWLDSWHSEFNRLIESLEAEIADNYLELPVDADGVPIRIGDVLDPPKGSEEYGRLMVTELTYDGEDWYFKGEIPASFTGQAGYFNVIGFTHAKPRTLEDVLIEYRLKAYNLYADQELTGDERVDEFIKLDAEYESEIRELLGGDAE